MQNTAPLHGDQCGEHAGISAIYEKDGNLYGLAWGLCMVLSIVSTVCLLFVGKLKPKK